MPEGNVNAILKCLAGARELGCSPEEARRRLFTANLAYVVPLGWYRYEVDDKSDQFFLADKEIIGRDGRARHERLCRGDLRLLRALHMHVVTPVTTGDVEGDAKSSRELTRTAFIKRKNRLSSVLPPGVIEHVPDANGQQGRLGYIFRRGLKRFIVLELTSGRMTEDDWETLLLPPPPQTDGGSHGS